MNDGVHVGRMRVRYRAPHDDPALKRRLDAVLQSVLDEGLEPALARSGVSLEGNVCIRSVRSSAYLRLESGDPAAVAVWSAAIADAVHAELARAGANAVRYRSRRAALTDLALGVAGGRLERAWAWRQLGLWQTGDAPVAQDAVAELLVALSAEPEAVVPVLGEVARVDLLDPLIAAVPPAGWTQLARLALAASFAPARLLEPAALSPVDHDAAPPSARRGGARKQAARRARAAAILERSILAQAFIAAVVRGRPAAPEVVASFATLACLEVEPAVVAATPAGTARELVAEVGEVLRTAAASPKTDDAAASALLKAPEPGAVKSPEARWTSRFAGLLFLLGVIDELDLPRELASGERSTAWLLHRLGLAITPGEPDDPAVLAFAGLRPGLPLPEGGDRPSPEEAAMLGAVAGRIAERLRERLERPKTPPDELLDLVCRRRGELVFDPGWIELCLPADEVSVELRRAGLDLDPGWLPWLGAVVRFAYV